jgi:aspartyl-tRNA(Asn)/glutamyl-tRNA(Gln) amidotransferase subunit A
VSRRGVFPLSYTLDHCGPLARTVADTALTMQVIAGHDAGDPASAEVAVPDFSASLGRDLAGLKLAYPRKFFASIPGVSPEVVAAMDAAAEAMARLGAGVAEVAFPEFELFNACGRVILIAEAYAVHEQDLKTRPQDFGRFTYQRIMPGATLMAADLVQALRLRRELTDFVNADVLRHHDAIITANTLTPAARFDEFPVDASFPVMIHTIPFNVTGNPVLAVPIGFSQGGLPLGMQIVGRAFDEPTILAIGAAYEAAASWTNQRPKLELKIAV